MLALCGERGGLEEPGGDVGVCWDSGLKSETVEEAFEVRCSCISGRGGKLWDPRFS